MPEVESGELRIHYDVVGSGEPVLLLHGGMASGEFWRRAGYVDVLARDHQVVLVDFRGHGASSCPHEESMYGLPDDVADTLAVIDAAGLDRVSVCGWSWGGTTGLALAALHPDRVARVLAVGSSGRHGRFSDLDGDFARFSESASKIETYGLEPVGAEMERLGGQRWLRDAVLDNDPLAVVAWYRGQCRAPALNRALADVRAPVLFMPGELEVPLLDFPSPLLPSQAELRPIPGANHVSAFLSVDEVVPALKELIASTTGVRNESNVQ